MEPSRRTKIERQDRQVLGARRRQAGLAELATMRVLNSRRSEDLTPFQRIIIQRMRPIVARLALTAAFFAPAPASPPPLGPACSPISNKGTCYEPGERCRNSDHGATGVADDGERIVCANNDGWRWEPM
jgi:hypothetical protein